MHKKNQNLLLGAHMSIAGGFYKAIERGESIGCTAIQIFTKSNRQWHAKEITAHDAQNFKTALANSSIQKVIAHAPYLINVGAANNDIRNRSIKALTQELIRCDLLNIPYLVLHPGSDADNNENKCIERIAAGIDEAYEAAPQVNTKILLETMAGQGNSIGHTFEQIASIMHHSTHKAKLGVCVDTCHVFAAGYDLNNNEQYDAMWNSFEALIGLKKLKAIHLNDSKKECGSRVDRHEDIGKGKIKLKTFELLLNDERFFDIPKILETPKDSLEDDARNMALLKQLIQ